MHLWNTLYHLRANLKDWKTRKYTYGKQQENQTKAWTGQYRQNWINYICLKDGNLSFNDDYITEV